MDKNTHAEGGDSSLTSTAAFCATRTKKDARPIFCEGPWTGEVLSREVFSREVLSREVLNREMLSKEVSNKEVLIKEVSSREVLSREVLSNEVLSNEVLSRDVLSREVLSGDVLSGGVFSGEVITREELSHCKSGSSGGDPLTDSGGSVSARARPPAPSCLPPPEKKRNCGPSSRQAVPLLEQSLGDDSPAHRAASSSGAIRSRREASVEMWSPSIVLRRLVASQEAQVSALLPELEMGEARVRELEADLRRVAWDCRAYRS